jgi:hypothetical protein
MLSSFGPVATQGVVAKYLSEEERDLVSEARECKEEILGADSPKGKRNWHYMP